jgi:hypothetical protein
VGGGEEKQDRLKIKLSAEEEKLGWKEAMGTEVSFYIISVWGISYVLIGHPQ